MYCIIYSFICYLSDINGHLKTIALYHCTNFKSHFHYISHCVLVVSICWLASLFKSFHFTRAPFGRSFHNVLLVKIATSPEQHEHKNRIQGQVMKKNFNERHGIVNLNIIDVLFSEFYFIQHQSFPN